MPEEFDYPLSTQTAEPQHVVIKHNKENLRDPQDVLRSPTEALRPWLQEACVRLNDMIFAQAYSLAEAKGVLNPDDPPRVRVGTELEMLIFSDQYDSTIDKAQNERDVGEPIVRSNPNYSLAHQDAVKRFVYDTLRGKSEGGLGYILQQGHDWDEGFQKIGKVLTEFRARPATVAGYMKNAEIIETYMREQAAARGIRPEVYANHLHVSLTDSQDGSNLMESPEIRSAIQKGMLDAYHRLLPLSRLPEEVDLDESSPYHRINSSSTRANGKGTGVSGDNDESAIRVEGRLNGTEYMYDPYLTLFVNLLGVYRGLRYASDPSQIDADYPLGVTSYGSIHFDTGKNTLNYSRAVNHLLQDAVLQEHLSTPVLRTLQLVFNNYWDISTGRKTVAQVRQGAEAMAQRLEELQPPQKVLVV